MRPPWVWEGPAMANRQLSSVLEYIRECTGAKEASALTDRELLDLFATRQDEAAFAAIVRRHGRLVLGVGQRVLRNLVDAEDAFQATFMVLPRRASAVPW